MLLIDACTSLLILISNMLIRSLKVYY